MGKINYLFIFTITPVQSFIAQARKTRDLYAGSRILSELIKKAIERAQKYNAEIIIPRLEENEDLNKIFSITNKFVAKFENVNEEELEKIGRNIEFNTLLFWKNSISKKVLENLKSKGLIKNNPNEEWFLKFNDHTTKYFNIYWLFHPLNSYHKDYKEAEKYLGAIKNIRCFEQFETDENHRKCSVCGERDAIVYRDRDKSENKKLSPFAYNNALEIKTNIMIEENEGLCGVCFVKRFYKYKEEDEFFPSTIKISRIDIFNDKEIEKKIKDEYKNLFSNCWNDQFLIEENLNKTYLKKQNCDLEQINLKEIREKLKEINDLIEKKGYKVSKYYALIKFDGDNMGTWLSGEFLKEGQKLEDFHTNLSKKLIEYAKWAKDYIDGNLENDKIQKGKTVYAGGDDYLGFINLSYLFEVLDKLRSEFDKKVNKELEEFKETDKNLTFSAGIVIAHYKDPLSLVLDWANKLEKEAKDLPNKNAFGIAVLKRSGEIRKAIYEWDKLQYIEEIFESIVRRQEFNSSFIIKLEEGFKKIFIDFYLYDKKRAEFIKDEIVLSDNYNFILTEVSRVLNKSSNIKDKKRKKIAIKNLKEKLNNLIDYENYDLEHLFGILNILKFIEREL